MNNLRMRRPRIERSRVNGPWTEVPRTGGSAAIITMYGKWFSENRMTGSQHH